MTEESLERLKHSLRVKEIVLDKLVLALLLLAAGLYGNFRLKHYETTLSRELEGLKAVYNLQRILAEKEISAHEGAWEAITEFRKEVDSFVGEKFSTGAEELLHAAGLKLASDLELQQLYLTDRSREAIETFFNTEVPAFIKEWSGPDGRGELTREKDAKLVAAVDAVRDVLVGEIKAKRQ